MSMVAVTNGEATFRQCGVHRSRCRMEQGHKNLGGRCVHGFARDAIHGAQRLAIPSSGVSPTSPLTDKLKVFEGRTHRRVNNRWRAGAIYPVPGSLSWV